MCAVTSWCMLVALTMASTFVSSQVAPGGMLYPRESETREVNSLDGLWNFRLSPPTDHRLGFDQSWFKHELSMVYIPSKLNVYLFKHNQNII